MPISVSQRISSRFFEELLGLPYPLLLYRLSQRLHDAFPEYAVLESEDYDFDFMAFADAGGCSCLPCPEFHAMGSFGWKEQQMEIVPTTGFYQIQWRGFDLLALTMQIGDSRYDKRCAIIAETQLVAESFFEAVCSYTTEGGRTILVMGSDGFGRDDELMDSISGATLADMDWMPEQRDALVKNCVRFFESEAIYRDKGLVWKRGVLLHGPPGNGKTHALRGLINHLKMPTLYVRSFKRSRMLETDSMSLLFQRARRIAPCVIVLEDLDSMVNESNLSFFLNEMDGLRPNHGILTIGTTNHLEKIDPALTERPSRFDRKVEFPAPDAPTRALYLSEIGVTARPELVRALEGFSVAFLAEWRISCELACIEDPLRDRGDVELEVAMALSRQLKVKRRRKKQAEDE